MARLPLRHHLALWTVGLLACIGAGAWLTTTAGDTVMWHYGALAGAVVAPVLVGLYARTLATSPATAPAGSETGSPGRRG